MIPGIFVFWRSTHSFNGDMAICESNTGNMGGIHPYNDGIRLTQIQIMISGTVVVVSYGNDVAASNQVFISILRGKNARGIKIIFIGALATRGCNHYTSIIVTKASGFLKNRGGQIQIYFIQKHHSIFLTSHLIPHPYPIYTGSDPIHPVLRLIPASKVVIKRAEGT